LLRLGKSVKFAEKQPLGQRRTGSPTIIALAVAAALTGTAPDIADAAGLGRLTVQSALGQPLRAEVEVTSLSRDESASLMARLAAPEAFRAAGLEFNPALTGLRFVVDRSNNGAPVVRITSSQPINEPFVDLMVELNWASGKFVREYTFLLDPPELRMGRESVAGGPSQIVPATTAGSGIAATAPAASGMAPASRAQATPPPATPASAVSGTVRTPTAAATNAMSTTPTAASTPAAASSPPAAGTEVTVRNGDTLAAIAARVKGPDVSVEQAIIALYRANPQAFFGSVHQMLAGAKLTVPDHSAMLAVDAGEARKEIRAQVAVFNAYRERLAATARRVEPARAGQSATGSITAAPPESTASAGAGDQLKLSRPEGGAATAQGSATGRSGTATAVETQVARDSVLREQQDRIDALEKNVADLQQLVELKNRQLAEMQQQAEAARAAGTTASGTVAGVGAVPATTAASAMPAASSEGVPSPAATPSSAGATPAAGSSEPSPGSEAAPATATSDAGEASPPAAAPTPPPVSAPAPVAEPGFFDQLNENPLVLPGAAAIILGLGAFGLYLARRRKKDDKFEDSLIAADAFTANSLFGSTGGQSVDTNNSLFASNVRDSGVDVHSTEVDPIAEAEVYIAYGREAQAEEILKEALKKQPERQAIRLKLLEIHAGRKDPVAFAALAQAMYDMTGGQNEEWPKVVTLGLSIDPANPLYTGQGDGGEASATPVEGGHSTGGALGLTAAAGAAAAVLGDGEPEGEQAAPRAAAGATFAETVPMDGGGSSADAAEVPALDFNLDLDTTIHRAVDRRDNGSADNQAAVPLDSDLSRAIDGRFELPSLEVQTHAPAASEVPADPPAGESAAGASGEFADLGDFKIDLPSLEGLDTLTLPTLEERQAPDEPAAIDFGDVDFDSPHANDGVSGHEYSGGDLGLATATAGVASAVDSSRWQEMATKLDLASAYEEIGDKEGARELLEEVLRDGDLTQQQKARGMLAKIG